MAVSLELCFGRSVLTRSDGTLTPVRWKGFDQGSQQWQGEIENKSDLQKQFEYILKEIDQGIMSLSEFDWTEIDQLLDTMHGAFGDKRGEVNY